MMKKRIFLVLTVLLLVSLPACSSKKPENMPSQSVSLQLPETVQLEWEAQWPQNSFTEQLPRPVGTVLWTMTDSAHNTCGIAVRGLGKKDVSGYTKRLEAAGFAEIKKAELPETGEGFISFGTLYSDGSRTVSLSYSDPVLMISIAGNGIRNTEGGLFSLSHIKNIYQNSYATYNETDGIGIVTELYVPKSESVKPCLTGLQAVAVVTLPQRQETIYFDCMMENLPSVSAVLPTGITAQSGETGTITVAGIAYASNALAGSGAFSVSYSITLP